MKLGNEKVEQVFEIKEDSKYIIKISYDRQLEPNTEMLDSFIRLVTDWWDSDLKFLLIYDYDDIKTEFIRIDDE